VEERLRIMDERHMHRGRVEQDRERVPWNAPRILYPRRGLRAPRQLHRQRVRDLPMQVRRWRASVHNRTVPEPVADEEGRPPVMVRGRATAPGSFDAARMVEASTNMNTADPIAHRVARRHQAAVVLRSVPAETRIEYRNAGTISAVALARMLEPSLGFLVRLRFRPALDGPPTTIAWEGLDANGDVVSGRLVLHAGVSESEVISWASWPTSTPASPTPSPRASTSRQSS